MSTFKIFGYISTIFGFVFLIAAFLVTFGYSAPSNLVPFTIFGLGAVACGVTLLSTRNEETNEIADFTRSDEQTTLIKQEEEPNQETEVTYDFSTTQASVEQEDEIGNDFSTKATIPTEQEQKDNHDLSTPQMERQPQTKTPNKSFSYMLFALGALLLIVGLFLVTYTTVVTVNQQMSLYGYTITVPTQEQISPYQSIGVFVLLGAMASIGYALYTVKEQTQ